MLEMSRRSFFKGFAALATTAAVGIPIAAEAKPIPEIDLVNGFLYMRRGDGHWRILGIIQSVAENLSIPVLMEIDIDNRYRGIPRPTEWTLEADIFSDADGMSLMQDSFISTDVSEFAMCRQGGVFKSHGFIRSVMNTFRSDLLECHVSILMAEK